MSETNNTVQVLTAGGAGASKSKRRNRGRRHRGTGNGGENKSLGDEREHSGDEMNVPTINVKEEDQNNTPATTSGGGVTGHHLEIEGTDSDDEAGVVDIVLTDPEDNNSGKKDGKMVSHTPYLDNPTSGTTKTSTSLPPLPKQDTTQHQVLWLFICFMGIMASFVCYGLLLEYTTSGGRKLHELSFLFVTSGLYTLTAAAGRYVRDETPSTIPPARFAVLGLTSMGSTFCSVRSLRCVNCNEPQWRQISPAHF